MDSSNAHVLVEAKAEYTRILSSILTPRLREGIFNVFQEALKHCRDTNTTSQLLVTFQKYLSSISRWSDYMVEEEYDRIQRLSKCDYMEDLITAVFVAHTKILTSIHTRAKIKKIDLTIPKPHTFIHRVYIECARLFWKEPYVFILSTKYSNEMDVSKINQQVNYSKSEEIIEKALQRSISRMLPVKSILSMYLGESVNDLMSDNIEDDGLNHDVVKTLIKKELEKHREENEEETGNGEENESKESVQENNETPEKEDEIRHVDEPTPQRNVNQDERVEATAETKAEDEISLLGAGKLQQEDKQEEVEKTANEDNTTTTITDKEIIDTVENLTIDIGDDINDVNINVINDNNNDSTIVNNDGDIRLNLEEEPENAESLPIQSTPQNPETAQEDGNIANIGNVLREVKEEVEKTNLNLDDNHSVVAKNETITFDENVEDNEGKTDRMMAEMEEEDDEDNEENNYTIVEGSPQNIDLEGLGIQYENIDDDESLAIAI